MFYHIILWTVICTESEIELILTKLNTDLNEWERTMRLREFFHDNQGRYKSQVDKRSSRNWTPGGGREHGWICTFRQYLKEDIVKNIKTQYKKNLSKREEAAVKDLLLDDSVVIRPADKGSGVVVLDAKDYEERLKKELEDSSTHSCIDKHITQDVCKRVNKLLRNLRNEGVIARELEQWTYDYKVSVGR